MSKVHIICDTPSDLTYEESLELGVELMPIIITWGGKDYYESRDISRPEFYEVLKNHPELPVTAQITPLRFLDSYKKALETGCTHIIVAPISAVASGTFTSANIAKEMFFAEHGRVLTIEIFDTKGFTYMYGDAIRQAAQLRNSGGSFEEILDLLADRAATTETVFFVYSLKQFKKSGRISGAASFIGEALGLRPIARIAGGRINVVEKARGDKNALTATIELLKKHKDPAGHNRFIVIHADTPIEDIETFERLLLENYPGAVLERENLGPCITINTGPNVLGVIYRGLIFKE